jgi:hypothetical protein
MHLSTKIQYIKTHTRWTLHTFFFVLDNFYKKKRRDGSNGSLVDSFIERARTFRQRFEYNKTDTLWTLYSDFIVLDDFYKKGGTAATDP